MTIDEALARVAALEAVLLECAGRFLEYEDEEQKLITSDHPMMRSLHRHEANRHGDMAAKITTTLAGPITGEEQR